MLFAFHDIQASKRIINVLAHRNLCSYFASQSKLLTSQAVCPNQAVCLNQAAHKIAQTGYDDAMRKTQNHALIFQKPPINPQEIALQAAVIAKWNAQRINSIPFAGQGERQIVSVFKGAAAYFEQLATQKGNLQLVAPQLESKDDQ